MTGHDVAIASLKIDSPPATLRKLALHRLRGAIVAGTFEPGTRLVERTLGDQLGVSRSVVREVIRHLETEGLIEMAKNGPIVALLDWNEARQIYDIRALLESAAVADCATRADATVKAELASILGDLDRAAADRDPGAMLEATIEFYAAIFTNSGHEIAWEIVSRLNSRISRLRVMTLATANRTVSGPARLRQILEAIERNDSETAAAACREHIAEAASIAATMLATPL